MNDIAPNDPVEEVESFADAEKFTDETFRDSIATVDDEGKRRWIYPRKPAGRFHRARIVVSIFLLLVFFTGPFVNVGGHPLLLLNVLERRFVIFGQPFFPQDFFIFVLAMILAVVFILLFTVIYGRLFCGWICPQTVFMELVFRKIEYWIEGDAQYQRSLDRKSWTGVKIFKKSLKHSVFFALSFIVSNTFMAYLIGAEEFFTRIKRPPTEEPGAFIAVFLFAGLFYFIFARFREQACIMVCPYGRLQGVLLDRNSIVVSYDFNRGEPKTILKKALNNPDAGDCIDCKQCVHVCPTGIDIRHGTQLECVNCTACIDACDKIMDRVGRSRGLIRYASYNTVESGSRLRLTPRMIAYTGVLIFIGGLFLYTIISRSAVETTILRTPGMLFQELDNGNLRNLYSIKIVNKSNEEIPIELKIAEPGYAEITMVGGEVILPAGDVIETAMFVDIPQEKIKSMKTSLRIDIRNGLDILETVKTSFMGPVR